MTFPPFHDWIRANRETLIEEYEEDNDEVFVTSEFVEWSRLRYDSEKLQHLLRSNR